MARADLNNEKNGGRKSRLTVPLKEYFNKLGIRGRKSACSLYKCTTVSECTVYLYPLHKVPLGAEVHKWYIHSGG